MQKWVAKDGDGVVCLYYEEPTWEGYQWWSDEGFCAMDEEVAPELKPGQKAEYTLRFEMVPGTLVESQKIPCE